MTRPSQRVLAWPFLVARGRYRGYRTLLAPDVLLRESDYGILGEVVVPSDHEDQPQITDVVTQAGRSLAIVYATHQVTAVDVATPGTDPARGAPHDQHSRPLQLIYGFVCLDTHLLEPDPADLRTCLDTALSVYGRFLANEEDFPVEAGQAFPIRHTASTARAVGPDRGIGRRGRPLAQLRIVDREPLLDMQ